MPFVIGAFVCVFFKSEEAARFARGAKRRCSAEGFRLRKTADSPSHAHKPFEPRKGAAQTICNADINPPARACFCRRQSLAEGSRLRETANSLQGAPKRAISFRNCPFFIPFFQFRFLSSTQSAASWMRALPAHFKLSAIYFLSAVSSLQ